MDDKNEPVAVRTKIAQMMFGQKEESFTVRLNAVIHGDEDEALKLEAVRSYSGPPEGLIPLFGQDKLGQEAIERYRSLISWE